MSKLSQRSPMDFNGEPNKEPTANKQDLIVAGLSLKQARAIMLLFEGAYLTQQDAARAMGISPSSFSGLRRRALAILKTNQREELRNALRIRRDLE